MMPSGVISKKQKRKRSIPLWIRDLCSFRPENDTKCAAKQVLTLFFFLEITPFSFYLEPRCFPAHSSRQVNLSVPILL